MKMMFHIRYIGRKEVNHRLIFIINITAVLPNQNGLTIQCFVVKDQDAPQLISSSVALRLIALLRSLVRCCSVGVCDISISKLQYLLLNTRTLTTYKHTQRLTYEYTHQGDV